jgi:transcriptional regulator with XRE-family HTH domain
MPGTELGSQLQRVRKLRNLSLKAAAEPAGISPAYLQKLERGLVKSPSPKVLHGLSESLNIPYSTLMKLAGYIVPDGDKDRGSSNVLALALSSEELTDDEVEVLSRYLTFYREDRAARDGQSGR